LPKEPRQVERREEPKPKPVVKPQPTESKTAEAADADTAAATGARVATAVDFPFVYYVDLIERRVSRNWHPPPLDSYRGRTRACLVQFVVGRGGEITRVSLAASSGVSFFDREAVAAVKSASPLPPLPAKFGGGELPVTIRFTLKPGF
jgi:protein TonB